MKRVSAFLSFFLPGLGQLSQKRPVWAIGFFTAFAAATAIKGVWWAVPLVALAAALETLRFPDPGRIADRRLRYSYGVVGGVGFLAWFSFIIGNWFPLGSQMQVNDDVAALRMAMKQCFSPHAGSPDTVLGCVKSSSAGSQKDPWGVAYSLSISEGFFQVRSSGPDRRSGTGDDLVYESRVSTGVPK